MTRRRWWLVAILGGLVVVRAALPEIVRRQAETRVSELLRARVQIGDVDLALLRGAVALEDVALRPAEPPAPGGADADDPPVLGWRRFAVNLRWWPLVQKNVRLSSVELDAPRVALDRLADGELNLLAFVPAAAGEEDAAQDAGAAPADGEAGPGDAEPEAAAPWGVGVDHLVVRGGVLRFRDFAVQEEQEPVDVRLPTIEVRDVAMAPGLYGGPARAGIDVRVDDGRLRVASRLWLRDGGVAVETTLRARRMPLERVRLYVPEVGWRELGGEFGASLVHRLETKKRNLVRGTVTLDDVEVHVPDVDAPALAWKHLGVAVRALDLEGHEARIERVELAGATVVVSPEGGRLLPVIGQGAKAAAEEVREDQAAPPAPPPAAAPAWRWSVGTVQVSDARVRVLTDAEGRDIGVALDARELAGDGDHPAPVKLQVTRETATLAIEGRARIADPGFDGTLVLKDLELPHLPTVETTLQPSALRGGRLGADLRLAVGSAATPPGDVAIAGSVEVAGFELVGADPKLFAAAFEALKIGIEEVRAPGVLAPPGGERKPVTVTLGEVSLAAPRVQLTRTTEGLVLPVFGAAKGAEGQDAAATPAEGEPAAPPPAPAPAAAPPPEIAVATLVVNDGELRISDRTVKPYFAGGFKPFALEARGLRHPPGTVERVKFTATSLTRGRLDVTGRRTLKDGQLEIVAKDVALEPFNPYATHYSPYSIAGGALSITTKATTAGAAYDSTTALTLDQFDLGGKQGDSLFKEQFGISLEVALALLRDLEGRIAFDIPVEGDERGAKVSVMTVAGQALRKAIVNALASPLKLVGAAFGGKEGGGAPAPIVFAVGRAEPTDGGAAALDALGGLLASRPGIGITLHGAPTAADVRWLREQALYDELSRPQGVFGAIGTLAQRGARERVRLALEARREGKEGALDADDAATLEEWLAERPPPGPKDLGALVQARLEHAAAVLREGHGVGSERVALGEPVTQPAEGEAVLTFEIGAAGGAGS